jgi:hypothetical protein
LPSPEDAATPSTPWSATAPRTCRAPTAEAQDINHLQLRSGTGIDGCEGADERTPD